MILPMLVARAGVCWLMTVLGARDPGWVCDASTRSPGVASVTRGGGWHHMMGQSEASIRGCWPIRGRPQVLVSHNWDRAGDKTGAEAELRLAMSWGWDVRPAPGLSLVSGHQPRPLIGGDRDIRWRPDGGCPGPAHGNHEPPSPALSYDDRTSAARRNVSTPWHNPVIGSPTGVRKQIFMVKWFLVS